MNYRRLIFCKVLLMSFIFSPAQKSENFQNFNVHKLADGVFACIHNFGGKAICNAAIIDNGEESIIFDCFLSPEAAKDLKKLVDIFDLSPIKYVINSHYHNDHIRGNQVFSEDVTFISTERTAQLIEKMEPLEIEDEQTYAEDQFRYYDSLYQNYSGSQDDRSYQQILMWRPYFQVLSKSKEEIKTVIPTKFVVDSLNLDGPARSIKLITKGGGHTESDLIAYLPDDKILLAGDLIFNESHPYLGNGNPDLLLNWYIYLDKLEINYIIPGHGEIGSKSLITQMRNYVINMKEAVDIWVNNGKSVDDLNELTIPNEYKEWWFDRFYMYNFRFLLNSIK